VQVKEGGKVELKIIVTHKLGDGVRSITKWMKLTMRPCKELFLQVRLKIFANLKLVRHLLLDMAFLVIGIGILQKILNLLADVLDLLNDPGGFFIFSWSMQLVFLGGRKG
jgi:hypothetical protein